MKTYAVDNISRFSQDVIKIEANTLAQAIEIARDDGGFIPIPDNGTFVDGTWELDCETRIA